MRFPRWIEKFLFPIYGLLDKYGPRRFCKCPDWEACGCGNQPPRHCMWCCLDLTKAQLVEQDRRDAADRAKPTVL